MNTHRCFDTLTTVITTSELMNDVFKLIFASGTDVLQIRTSSTVITSIQNVCLSHTKIFSTLSTTAKTAVIEIIAFRALLKTLMDMTTSRVNNNNKIKVCPFLMATCYPYN